MRVFGMHPSASRAARVALALVVALSSAILVPGSAVAADAYESAGLWPGVTWPLTTPKGLCTDAGGNVYVADTGNDRIVKFDVAGRFVTSWGGTGSEPGKFDEPFDVACDPTGRTVYVADTMNHRIQQFTVSGANVTYVRRWGKEGGPDYTGSNPGEFNQPRGVALDGSGNVYVVDTLNYRVQKFSGAGVYERQWGTAGSDVDKFLEPTGIDVAPSGLVYVVDANRTNCYVRAFTALGVPASFPNGGNGWGAYALVRTQGRFRHPVGITVDDDGYVYVVDSSITSCWVQKFTFDGEFVTGWGERGYGDTSETGAPLFLEPAGMDASGSGTNVRVMVADCERRSGLSVSGGDRIREFDGQGLPISARDRLGVLGSHGDATERTDEPWDVACGPAGSVFVADRLNHRVQRLNATGNIDRVTPASIPAVPRVDNGSFTEPAAVAWDPVTRFVFVAEAGSNHRVQRLTEDLTYEGHKWGALGTANGAFNKPQGIAVGPSPTGGRWVYVADTGNNRIQVFEIDGTHKVTITGLLTPGGLVVDTDGTIYCADSGNRRVVRLTHNESWSAWTIASTFGSSGTGDAVLSRPWGVAMDSLGDLYVSDADAHRIKKYSKTGVFLAAWASKGSVMNQVDSPRGLDVTDQGVVYVADSINDRIHAFVTPIAMDILAPVDGRYYNGPVMPNVSFGSGAVSAGVDLDGEPWDSGPVSQEGVHVLRAWATDSRGMTHARVAQFVIDMAKPVTIANATLGYANAAHINLTATDALSGVQATRWQLDGGSLNTGTSIYVTAAGPHTLTYWSEDLAGNIEESHQAAFTVSDTLPPVTGANVQPEYADQARIRLTASDAGSAVTGTFYRVDEGPVLTGLDITVAGLGSHTLQYWSRDAAGNVEQTQSASFSVKAATRVSASRVAAVVAYGGSAQVRAATYSLGSPLHSKPLKLYRSYDATGWTYVATVSPVSASYSYATRIYRMTYFKWVFEGDDLHMPASASVRVAARAALSAPAVRSITYRNKMTLVSGDLRPRHDSGSRCVRILAYRYESGRWVYRRSFLFGVRDRDSYSRYTDYIALPYKGRWRIRAYHSDAGHAPTSSVYRNVTVM